MDYLTVPSRTNSAKAKALEAGRKMQDMIIAASNKEDRIPPKYALNELIGRGSFGLVYKGHDVMTAEVVAVKIIDIDQSDLASPRYADTYNEFLKEVAALKQLRESKAQNINHVIDALSVGTTLWLITEYCGGGSVATLMKPTAPGGLDEKWITPILRETAVAIKWVHEAGIIHRDIKCANILVTEQGGVKLCDFGVAGTVESSLQKRSTFAGTPHWMAPELFDSERSYGKEVDIWAFGAMIHEVATGFPPNVQSGISYSSLGSHLQNNAPTLKGRDLSTGLQDLAACCLEMCPSDRPSIDQIRQHPYIYQTEATYPASSLSELVRSYAVWERLGNGRKSLATSMDPPAKIREEDSEEWIFTTATAVESVPQKDLEEAITKNKNAKLTITIPASSGSLEHLVLAAGRHGSLSGRLPALQSPLEQAFDPEIMLNYEENSQRYYSPPPQASDFGPAMPSQGMRSSPASLIDLGDFEPDVGLASNFEGLGLNLNNGQQQKISDEGGVYNAISEGGRCELPCCQNDLNKFLRNDDWKLPSGGEQLSLKYTADDMKEEIFRHSCTSECSVPCRPSLRHYSSDPTGKKMKNEDDWISSRDSLVDLSLTTPGLTCPLFPNVVSEPSPTSSEGPFDLERVAEVAARKYSLNVDIHPQLTEVSSYPSVQRSLPEVAHNMPFSTPLNEHRRASFQVLPPPGFSFPDLPSGPSDAALRGELSTEEAAKEVARMLDGLQEQLIGFQSVYHTVADAMRRREARTPNERET